MFLLVTKNSKKEKPVKKETLAEYLARGGKITKVPVNPFVSQEAMRLSTGGPANIMTLDQADLYYGERKTRKTKIKSKSTIDLSALPPALKKKYVDDVIAASEEGDEG